MKKNKTTFILVLFFFMGLLILFYPSFSNYTNTKLQNKAINNYEKLLSNLEDYDKYFDEATEYNEKLMKLKNPFLDYDKVNGYNDILNADNDGMIGYISIEKINVELSIYHGTSSKTLNQYVGHLEGSSLPTGETSTHTVLSAHRGLPSSKLFTDLDKLEIGDTFTVKVYDRTFTYEVDQIKIVRPNEVDDLKVEEDEDYVTLMTCTPFGINTHRLLVRGHRVTNRSVTKYISTEAYKINKLIVTPIMCIPILFLWLLSIAITPVQKNNNMYKMFVYPTEYKKNLKK